MNGSGENVAGCANCSGRCCRTYRVEITVADLQTLARGMSLPPSEFIVLRPVEGKKPGFRLRADGPAMELDLIRRKPTGACVFLMEIGPGKARCGVYAHRPTVCRIFPAAIERGAVGIRSEVTCAPDSWNLAAMDLTSYRQQLNRHSAVWSEHWQIVKAWNAKIDAGTHEKSSDDLFEYLLSYSPVP